MSGLLTLREAGLPGLFWLRPSEIADHRGSFARLTCAESLRALGLDGRVAQVNRSFSPAAGTLRGLHLQGPPRSEAKLFHCVRGASFHAAVDLRAGSPTFGQHATVTLRASDPDQLYVPAGFAHGLLTLEDDTELIYTVSEAWSAEHELTLRWDDPELSVRWPRAALHLSVKDRAASSLGALRERLCASP